MAPSSSTQSRPPDDLRALRTELAALADMLVDARPADRPELQARVRHAVDAQRRCVGDQDEIARLLRYIATDLSAEADSLDTLYYARLLAVVVDRLPN